VRINTPISETLSDVKLGTVFENKRHGIQTLIATADIPFNTTEFKCPTRQQTPIARVPFLASSAPAAAMTTSFKTGFTAIPTRQHPNPPRGIKVHIISPSGGELIANLGQRTWGVGGD
jgi:hypothetical protein